MSSCSVMLTCLSALPPQRNVINASATCAEFTARDFRFANALLHAVRSRTSRYRSIVDGSSAPGKVLVAHTRRPHTKGSSCFYQQSELPQSEQLSELQTSFSLPWEDKVKSGSSKGFWAASCGPMHCLSVANSVSACALPPSVRTGGS